MPPKQSLPPLTLQNIRPSQLLVQSKDFIIVNKPPLCFSQPGKGPRHVRTLKDILKYQYPYMFNPENIKPNYIAPEIIHRLDYPVTGAMILATSEIAVRQFSKGMRSTGRKGWQIDRHYFGILQGTPEDLHRTSNNKFVEWSSENAGTVKNILLEKEAITNFEILDTNGITTLMSFKPVTGRKHQIRSHSARVLGLCLVNDDGKIKKHHRPIALHSAEMFLKTPDLHINVKAPVIHNRDMWSAYPQVMNWAWEW